MATFIINTNTEFRKCRRTAAWWLTLAGSAFIPLLLMTAAIADPDEFVPGFKNNPWQSLMMMCWQPAAAFFLPIFVIMVASLVVQIEYRNNTWKQVYASPRSYADIFFSKFTVIHMLILGWFLLFNLFVLLSGFTANLFHKEFAFFDSAIPWRTMASFSARMYVSVLAISAIQYWLSLRIRNYIAPLGIGLALLITGLMNVEFKRTDFHPFSYPAVTFFRNMESNGFSRHEWYSIMWFLTVVLLAFLDTSRRKERG